MTLRCSYMYRRGSYNKQFCGSRTERPYCNHHSRTRAIPPTITLRLSEDPQWLTAYSALELEIDSPVMEAITEYLKWVNACVDHFVVKRNYKRTDEEKDPGVTAALMSIWGEGPALTYPVVSSDPSINGTWTTL